MREYIKEQLGFDADEDSGLDDQSDEEIEEIYREMMEKEKQAEQQPESQTEPGLKKRTKHRAQTTQKAKPKTQTDKEEHQEPQAKQNTPLETKSLSEEGQPPPQAKPHEQSTGSDLFLQYRLIMQQALEMAKEWTERLGSEYAPFIESSAEGITYGAAHNTNAAYTKFSELALPQKLVADLALGQINRHGEVYRWALAEYEKLLAKANKILKDSTKPERGWIEEKPACIVVHTVVGSSWTSWEGKEYVIMIPEKIQRVLSG